MHSKFPASVRTKRKIEGIGGADAGVDQSSGYVGGRLKACGANEEMSHP